MQEHIPDALVAAFERQYGVHWNHAGMSNERLAMRYGWAAATEAKQCLHQFQEPAPVQTAQSDAIVECPLCQGFGSTTSEAVAESDGWRELAARVMEALADAQERTNAEHPEHVKYYPSWEQQVRRLRWHAEMFRTGRPIGNGAGQPAVLAALAANLAPPDSESVLINGTAYDVPAAVAGELLRLHLEILAVMPPADARTGDAGLKQFLGAANDAGITHLPKSFGKALREHLETAAAPVVLPEPAVTACVKRTAASSWNVEFNWHQDALKHEGDQKLFTEQQVRALLATAAGLPAQPIAYLRAAATLPEFGGVQVWKNDGTAFPVFAASQAQADARDALTPAARDVLAERQRQITQEGYDPQHDDHHVNDEIAAMASLLLMPEGARDWDATSTSYGDTVAEAILPCDWEMPNFGDDRRRQLVKGAAMGLAEIERFDRAAIAAAKEE
ncbi:hypothetical protein [Comamonas sp.]|uniref:hypothetical protein n=1 Tax=Comamonas sp. TaxID=34028 RepID=UPI003A908C09